MTRSADLPPLYELVNLEETPDVCAEAIRLAEQGADEGTLVWAHRQAAGRADHQGGWLGTPGGLLCALILRPEMPVSTAAEVVLVAVVSLGAALADVVSPMTRLSYRWPGSVLLNEGKAAKVWLEMGPVFNDQSPWCVLGVGVNIVRPPPALGFAAASVEEEGDCRISPTDVLEHFARHFLGWINRWAEEGFDPVRTAWLQRAGGMGEHIRVALDGEAVSGTAVEIDAAGALVVDVAGQGPRRLGLRDYFAG
ncbi:MAG TPA: biotin--[acetyl-CoA-carboxylase] ligase [Gammaproteobacteria bacterium]|nr:biotin--[acetyl-CoA-carboxylase] ligase [Gammaproteobacteria bacterium]